MVDTVYVLSKKQESNADPSKCQFYYIKVGLKGLNSMDMLNWTNVKFLDYFKRVVNSCTQGNVRLFSWSITMCHRNHFFFISLTSICTAMRTFWNT